MVCVYHVNIVHGALFDLVKFMCHEYINISYLIKESI